MSGFCGPILPRFEPLESALRDFDGTQGYDVLDRASKVANRRPEFGTHRWGEFLRACQEREGAK